MELVKTSCNTVKNYRGKKVYNSAGINFILYIIFLSTILFIADNVFFNENNFTVFFLLSCTLSAAFTGYLDDNNSCTAKGIIGHGKLLLKGILTSGCIKALISIMLSIILSLSVSVSKIDILVNFLLICLMQNFINLMDLKPGRAIKTYICISLLSIPFIELSSIYSAECLGMIILLLFYLPCELDESFMMGDTGANILGVLIGITIATSNGLFFKLIILFIIFFAHIYSEFGSLSSLIKSNSLLNFFDMIGRKEHDEN